MNFSQSPSAQVVSICTSQSLRRFDLPLLRSLSRQYNVAQWEYCQEPDEPVDVNMAIALLHEYLQTCKVFALFTPLRRRRHRGKHCVNFLT